MGGDQMTENFDVQALFDEYVNVETTVYYWDNTPNVTLSSLRSAADYLKGHPGPAELHVHNPAIVSSMIATRSPPSLKRYRGGAAPTTIAMGIAANALANDYVGGGRDER
jgi:hypothetical protein